MQLRLTHDFHAPLAEVFEALASSDYATHLAHAHSFFDEIRVLSRVESDLRVQRAVRYRARPFMTRLGPFSLPADWFEWTEQSSFDRRLGLLSFENIPERDSLRGKVINRGTMKFRAQRAEDGSWVTTREALFEIDLEVPRLFRSLAQLGLARMRGQLVSALDEEARLLARWLAGAERANDTGALLWTRGVGT